MSQTPVMKTGEHLNLYDCTASVTGSCRKSVKWWASYAGGSVYSNKWSISNIFFLAKNNMNRNVFKTKNIISSFVVNKLKYPTYLKAEISPSIRFMKAGKQSQPGKTVKRRVLLTFTLCVSDDTTWAYSSKQSPQWMYSDSINTKEEALQMCSFLLRRGSHSYFAYQDYSPIPTSSQP